MSELNSTSLIITFGTISFFGLVLVLSNAFPVGCGRKYCRILTLAVIAFLAGFGCVCLAGGSY